MKDDNDNVLNVGEKAHVADKAVVLPDKTKGPTVMSLAWGQKPMP